MEGMLITLNPAWMSSEDFEFIPPPRAKELAPFWYHLTQSVICCRLLFAKPVNTLLESQVVSLPLLIQTPVIGSGPTQMTSS